VKRIELKESEYIVMPAKILEARMMTSQEKYFKIALEEGISLDHDPGQFVMVSLLGIGEAPISVSSSPTKRIKWRREILWGFAGLLGADFRCRY
jgi:sulfhydrogenase subunit gamma (sulfur reductase)